MGIHTSAPFGKQSNFFARSTTSGITASTNQAQGQQALVSELNEVSVCANNGDVVTLPSCEIGHEVIIVNNGDKTLQIFPASGDNLGSGSNISHELEPNETIDYVGITATVWHIESSTEIAHAEMFDTDNSDVYVINDVGTDDQGYHTNGMAAGDLAGWTFDIGGAGTSHAIASVADGAVNGVDIAVTTSTSHGLIAGDIVSHSNVTVAAYAGYFVVKAKISDTVYEVAAVFSSTATGTADQPATLKCAPDAAGQYLVSWSASAIAVSNNDIINFAIHVEEAHIAATNQKRKFGVAADVGSMSGVGIIAVGANEHVSFMVFNETGSGNVTLIDFTLVLVRL